MASMLCFAFVSILKKLGRFITPIIAQPLDILIGYDWLIGGLNMYR